MKRNTVVDWFTLFITICLAGCASYTPSAARLDTSGPHVVKQQKGDLDLYVEEFITKEQCEKAFNTDLTEEGVLPLLILVRNNSQQSYEVRTADIILRGGDNVTKALTPEEAAFKAKRNLVGRALGWSMIVPIIGIPVAVAASANHTSKVNEQIIRDFAARSFPDGVITPDKESSGFLFYQLKEGCKNLSGLSLEVAARNKDDGKTITISTSLPAATFKAVKHVTVQEEQK